MPSEEVCTVCNGTGNSPYEDGKKCTNCAWTGKVIRKDNAA
jgi:DnaJ-class molecular chaperone